MTSTVEERPTAPPGGRAMPPRWKTAVLIWLAIYPSITFLLWLAGPQIASWPLPLRTLALTAVLVPLMVFLLIPAIQRLLAPWLRPRRATKAERMSGAPADHQP
jgi:antibiotic biosynthesis monooxygenase (ABM) superfamily enzyme